ncbi:MAG: glycosyltransferase family 2 protein [Oscillatoriales cyanobacterium SM2_3_0]|nr:glycosyltransferase family 2 protein [Oscillatoriales cyanobacterium SM2_3_0]
MDNSFKWSGLTLSVVIPVYNGGEKFNRCLQSLTQSTLMPMELIVVADGDTDGSREMAKQFGAKVICFPEPGGPARARNRGAQAAKGDIVFFIDADVEVHPDTIDQVATAFVEDPELTALIGSYDDQPGANNFLSQYRNLLHHYTHQISNHQASTFWGACGAIRREVFLSIGGFDEKYRLPCIEDIELGYRLKRGGHCIDLRKDIQVKHLKEWRPISMVKADFFYRALPWTALLLRDLQFNNDLNLQYSSRLSVVLVYGAICALILATLVPESLMLVLIFAAVLLSLNAPVYRFFYTKRGLFFTARTIPWHWLYYFYSGLAFAVGLVRHWLQPSRIDRVPGRVAS